MLLVYDLQEGSFLKAGANRSLMAGRKTTEAICRLCVFFGALPQNSAARTPKGAHVHCSAPRDRLTEAPLQPTGSTGGCLYAGKVRAQ